MVAEELLVLLWKHVFYLSAVMVFPAASLVRIRKFGRHLCRDEPMKSRSWWSARFLSVQM